MSVPQDRVINPVEADRISSIGSSTMTDTRMPSNSREAIVRKASPRANAHAAFRRFREHANHLASRVGRPSWHRQPPIATVSPSAFASSLKTSPRFLAADLHSAMRPCFNSEAMNLRMSTSMTGSLGLANLAPAQLQAYSGPRKGRMCSSGPAKNCNLPRPSRNSPRRTLLSRALSLHQAIAPWARDSVMPISKRPTSRTYPIHSDLMPPHSLCYATE